MSYNSEIRLTPESLALVARSQKWPVQVVPVLAKELDHQNHLTIGHASARHLRGPRPKNLGVDTGRLWKSLGEYAAAGKGAATFASGAIVSSIGTNLVYAGVHEFGYRGTVQVAAHTRKVNTYAGGSKFVATLQKNGSIKNQKAKITATGTQQVKAHARKMNMPERSFLRSSLSERAADYSAALSAAVIKVLRTGSS